MTATPGTVTSTVPASTKIVVRLGLLIAGAGLAIGVFQRLDAGSDAASPASPVATDAHNAYPLPDFSQILQHTGLIVAAVCVLGFVAFVKSCTKAR